MVAKVGRVRAAAFPKRHLQVWRAAAVMWCFLGLKFLSPGTYINHNISTALNAALE